MEQTSPIIIQNSASEQKKNIFPGVPSSLPKIIFVILILIIVAELIWGVWYILKPNPSYIAEASKIEIIPPEPEADIELVSSTKEVKPGDTLPVDIQIYAAGTNTYGADLVVKYDPSILSLQGTPNLIFTKGELYSDYLGQESETERGIFRVSGISNVYSGVETDDIFGTLNFKAVKSGLTNISIEFSDGSTDDSNVIDDQGQDVLNSVTNLDINVL